MLEILRAGSLLLDAAMGTTLMAEGLAGRAPAWNLSHPERVQAVHEAHVRAGAELVLTNTFVGATPEESRAALRLARASGARFVGGCLWAGLSTLEEQVEQLAEADSLWLEAATSARQALGALRLASAISALPIVVTCAMPVAPLDELRAAGAAAVGYACSPWPTDASGADVIKLAAEGLSAADWAGKLPPARLRGGCCGTDERYLTALRAAAR